MGTHHSLQTGFLGTRKLVYGKRKRKSPLVPSEDYSAMFPGLIPPPRQISSSPLPRVLIPTTEDNVGLLGSALCFCYRSGKC